jgi:hypothetical protein
LAKHAPAAPPAFSLTLLPGHMALCRLPASGAVPEWTARARTFLTISRTPTELSIVADDDAVPRDVAAERGFCALRVDGPMALDLVGVVAALAGPLAAAGVPIFPIATYDTDYVLVRETELARATSALKAAGHVIR